MVGQADNQSETQAKFNQDLLLNSRWNREVKQPENLFETTNNSTKKNRPSFEGHAS